MSVLSYYYQSFEKEEKEKKTRKKAKIQKKEKRIKLLNYFVTSELFYYFYFLI